MPQSSSVSSRAPVSAGHTPGHSVLRLASGSDRAVFVGDLLHSPLQIVGPCFNSSACVAPEQAVASRRRVLQRAVDERELLVPGHFGGAGALEIRQENGRFALGAWAPFTAARLLRPTKTADGPRE
ncbi:MBL fold metallo-hydrolase [Pseudonocardia cypriaca]|uniref:MBL fold metallo-hydrolase n=1 Tax=Pseudonocardia cypriaca TaxID=882449 RepID=UPI001B878DC7|nr:MBL fold metallo-hydrolase [Pseudonocardia cypriaca]